LGRGHLLGQQPLLFVQPRAQLLQVRFHCRHAGRWTYIGVDATTPVTAAQLLLNTVRLLKHPWCQPKNFRF
jgi:hypothetical protein